MKLVCVYDPSKTTSTLSGASTVILPPPASQVDNSITVDNFPVFTSISFTASQGSYSGSGIIQGSSVNTTGDNKPMVLMGDKVTITLTNPDGETTTATITVSDCNQTSTTVD